MDNRIFTHARYNEIVDHTTKELVKLGQLKGGEYAGDEDRLANFRRNATTMGTTMELVWRVYASKHWDALMQYERDLREGKTRERLEGLAGRCDDLIVYLILFKCMIEERDAAPTLKPDGINYVPAATVNRLPSQFRCAVCGGTGEYLGTACPHCKGKGQLTLRADGSSEPASPPTG